MSERGFYNEGDLVAVLTAEPLDRLLDYKAPEGGVFAGAFVMVPLGPRRVLGVVWGVVAGGFDIAKARAIGQVLDVPPMRSEMFEFLTKAAEYTLTPLSMMLRLATRAPGLGQPASMRKILRLGLVAPNKMT
jgi:primosomal protein N' (replication factor Y)